MPNHIHAILIFKSNGQNLGECYAGNKPPPSSGESHSPSTSGHTSIQWEGEGRGEGEGECYSPLTGPSHTVGAVVRGYKGAVTKQCNMLNIGRPVWQRDYYEHIIRDERAYLNISNYIYNNPLKWWNDKFYR